MPFAFYYLHCNIYIYVDWNHVLHDEQHWKMFKKVNSAAVTIHLSEIRNCPNFNSAHQHSIIWQLAIAKLGSLIYQYVCCKNLISLFYRYLVHEASKVKQLQRRKLFCSFLYLWNMKSHGLFIPLLFCRVLHFSLFVDM